MVVFMDMQRHLCGLFLLALSWGPGPAHAALQSRLAGLAVYDTDRDITWTANANINFLLNWAEANTWAENLVYGGYSDWRLPTTLQPDATCSDQNTVETPPISFNNNCSGSEMGHLFYTELGGVAGSSILTINNGLLSLFTNTALVNSFRYWSGTEFSPNPANFAWSFSLGDGTQIAYDKSFGAWALAVRPGDVDADGDLVVDHLDNCTLVANPTQLDADGDGYGNACDADLNNSGTVTTADFGLLRSVLGQAAGSSALAAASDLNGSGTVTTADFGLLRARLGTVPGPSGLHPNCPPTCP